METVTAAVQLLLFKDIKPVMPINFNAIISRGKATALPG
jgi:hypothetical protein